MQRVLMLFRNRNIILVLAVVVGLVFGEWARYVSFLNVWALGLSMTFAMAALPLSQLTSIKSVIKPMAYGAILNYLLFGMVVIGLAYLLMPTDALFYGFVVVAATPPGVAIIPFSAILRGDMRFATVGVAGAFLASILLAPAIIYLFAGSDGVKPLPLVMLMVQLVLIPFAASRLLRMGSVQQQAERIRGSVVDWCFAFLIFVAVGLNREVFFSDPAVLLRVALVLVGATFGLGLLLITLYERYGGRHDMAISLSLLATIKSSGFSVFTSIALFGQEAAVPSAVLAVVVLLYLLFLSVQTEFKTSTS